MVRFRLVGHGYKWPGHSSENATVLNEQTAILMSKKRIFGHWAGSGFGEGAAIGLAQDAHEVRQAFISAPQ
jgi:hypothetical protein